MNPKVEACCMGMMGLALVAGIAITELTKPQTELISYQKEVDYGETVWSICGKIATDEDDLMELVRQTIEDNHIENPDALKPGSVITVNVKRAREK